MRQTSLLSSLALGGSMVMAACLGGTDLVPPGTGSSTTTGAGGGATTTGTGGGATTTTGMGGDATTSTGMGGEVTTTGMGGAATTTGMGGATSTGMGGSGGATSTGMGGAATSTGMGGATSTGTGTGGGGVVVGDPPCEVLTYFERKCWNCHATTAHSESGLSLVTYKDLVAASDEDPTKTNAERSMITMQDPLDPMPPGASPWATPAELAALQAWIDAGYPPSMCGDLAKDPYAAPPKCTSGVIIDPNNEEGEEMNPGWACNTCHQQQNSEMGAHAPIYHFTGTVYPSAHEPDNCSGASAEGAEIEVVDANGTVYIATANAVGNFFFEDLDHAFTYPYKVRLVFQGRERWMDTPEMDGDCNKCHTAAGTDDAPGRILLP